MIRFATEPTTRQLPTAWEHRWTSDDGRWAVLELFGLQFGTRRRRERILLVRCLEAGEYVVGRFHCRRAAVRQARELEQQPVRHRRRRRVRLDN